MSAPRDPYRDEREGARIHEERRREEAEEKRTFAKSLRRRLYGRIAFLAIALIAVGGLAFKMRPRPEPPQPEFRVLLKAPECAALAADYRVSLAPLRKCGSDGDCVAEKRGGMTSGLDGCVRILSRGADPTAANVIANDWITGGCAMSFRSCKQPRAPICEEGKCVEGPPEGVPHSWQRRELLGLLTFWTPKDMTEDRVLGEDSWVSQFSSDDLEIHFDVQHTHEPDAALPELRAGETALYMTLLDVDGIIGQLTRVKRADGKPAVQVLFPYFPAAPEAAYTSGVAGFVEGWAECKDDAQCAIVERIFKSIERW
jgi:hypothetical protein